MHDDLTSRAARRVLNARTISAKVDGEMAARVDQRVRDVIAEQGSYSVAQLLRSALRVYFEQVDAQHGPALDVIDGTAHDA